MLLPALLSSYGYGPGAGSVGTGDATAIGNDSETFVKQVAMAASSGDGMASIVQEVLVANMGVAGANTGGNTLGGRYADLDPSTAEAVVKMAAFLASMLSMVHSATGSAMAGLTESGHRDPVRRPGAHRRRDARHLRHVRKHGQRRSRQHPSDLDRAEPRCRQVEHRLEHRDHDAGAG